MNEIFDVEKLNRITNELEWKAAYGQIDYIMHDLVRGNQLQRLNGCFYY